MEVTPKYDESVAVNAIWIGGIHTSRAVTEVLSVAVCSGQVFLTQLCNHLGWMSDDVRRSCENEPVSATLFKHVQWILVNTVILQ